MSTDRPIRAAVFWSFAAIYIVWGSTYLAIRVVVTEVPPLVQAGARFLLAGGLIYAWARRKGAPSPTLGHWRYAFLLGAGFFLLGNGGISWAETRIPSGLTALLAATSPLWTAVFESARTGWQRPPLPILAGILAGLSGVALLVAPGDFIEGRHADLLGAAVITLAALGWASASVASHAKPLHESPQLATGMTMIAGGTLLVIAALVTGEVFEFSSTSLTPRVIFSWVYLVVLGSLVGFSAFLYLLRVSTPQKVSTSAFVNPLVAVFLGWLILGEPINPRTVVAGAVILGAVVLIRGVGLSKQGSARSEKGTT